MYIKKLISLIYANYPGTQAFIMSKIIDLAGAISKSKLLNSIKFKDETTLGGCIFYWMLFSLMPTTMGCIENTYKWYYESWLHHYQKKGQSYLETVEAMDRNPLTPVQLSQTYRELIFEKIETGDSE